MKLYPQKFGGLSKTQDDIVQLLWDIGNKISNIGSFFSNMGTNIVEKNCKCEKCEERKLRKL